MLLYRQKLVLVKVGHLAGLVIVLRNLQMPAELNFVFDLHARESLVDGSRWRAWLDEVC